MANEAQFTYWNEVAGPKWLKISDAMDARFSGITAALFNAADVQPGMKVLDVGCGTGATALALAHKTQPDGHVTGIDLSVPMLERARAAAISNVDFLQGDVETFDFGGQRFDRLVSRFGVMFFGDPVAAFRNLRGTLAPQGRLCFACWAPLTDNPHWQIPFDIVAARLGEPAARPAHAPGPMAFSDIVYVEKILADAGYSNVTVKPTAVSIIGKSLDEEADIACLLGPSGALLDEKKTDAETRAQLRTKIRDAIADFATPSGMQLPATIFVVTGLA